MDMEKKYYCIHDWMTKDLGLRGNERDVYAVIYSFAESCGVFTGGLKYLGQRTGASKPTVMESLRRLLSKDLLIKTERLENGVKLCEYCVDPRRIAAWLPGQESLPGEGKQLARPGQESLPGEGKQLARPGQETLPGEGKQFTRPGQETLPNNKDYNKEYIKEDTKESEIPRPAKTDRHKYGEYENVLLTDEEAGKLKSEFPDDWRQRIDRLSEYMASTGKKYRNHLATIRAWARMDEPKPERKSRYADLKGGISV